VGEEEAAGVGGQTVYELASEALHQVWGFETLKVTVKRGLPLFTSESSMV
jgi:hypothetical protein